MGGWSSSQKGRKFPNWEGILYVNSVTRPLAAGIILFTGEISAIVEYHHLLLFLPSLATIFLLPSSSYNFIQSSSYHLLLPSSCYHLLRIFFAAHLFNCFRSLESCFAAYQLAPTPECKCSVRRRTCRIRVSQPSYLLLPFAFH